jgi:hypothetical protein
VVHRALRARRDLDTLRSKMSFSVCFQAQKAGPIQIRAKKVVDFGEVTCINARRFYQQSGVFGREYGCWWRCFSDDTVLLRQLLVEDRSYVHVCDRE